MTVVETKDSANGRWHWAIASAVRESATLTKEERGRPTD
jgi:hypothetical protein